MIVSILNPLVSFQNRIFITMQQHNSRRRSSSAWEEVKMMEAEMDAAHQELEDEFVDIQIMSSDDSSNDSSPDLQLSSLDVRQSPLSLAAATSSSPSPDNYSDKHTQLSVTISYSYMQALTTLALWITSAPTGLCLAFIMFFFSVIAQMYPTAPQSGPFVALLLALFQIKSVSSSWQDKGRMTHIVSLVTIIVMTIAFDVDWLISNYIVYSDDFHFEEKLMQLVGVCVGSTLYPWYIVGPSCQVGW